ncbi:MAG TPA: formyltransferase family protein [Pseudolabrys sp.]
MFDTVILLTGSIEERALAPVLRRHSPDLDVRNIKTLDELEVLPRTLLARARLIGFVTPVIVPQQILESLGFGAYNFHPGPPHYPGWVPSHFAIYERAVLFGATAHMMHERVDSGPIVGVEIFPVPPDPTVERLEALALVALARIFWSLSEQLALQTTPLTELPITWSGKRTTHRDYAALCEISAGISKSELDRRISVIGNGHFGLAPTITVHGHAFRYEPAQAATTSP